MLCGTFQAMETQLDKQVKLVQAQHPNWEYDRCAFLAVEAQVRHEHAGRDPRLERAFKKHDALDDRNTSFEIGKYAKLLDEAHKLRQKDPLLTFGLAIALAREAHPELRSVKDGGPRAPGDKVKAQQ
jgi:hypothetical protein